MVIFYCFDHMDSSQEQQKNYKGNECMILGLRKDILPIVRIYATCPSTKLMHVGFPNE